MNVVNSKNIEMKTSDNVENKSSPAEKVYQNLTKVTNKFNEILFDDDTLNNDINKGIENGDSTDTKREFDVSDSGENPDKETPDLLLKNISELMSRLFSDDTCDIPSEGDAEDNSGLEGPLEDNIDDENSEDRCLEREISEEKKSKMIQDFLDGKLDFEEVKEIYAGYYADAVNSNRYWAWNETIPGGDALSAGQKKQIKDCAEEKGLIPKVSKVEKDGGTYADFSEFTVFQCVLDKEDWTKTDSEQFDKCNKQLKEAISKDPELAKQFTPDQINQIMNGYTLLGYTWHHSEVDGTMQLVPYGIHNVTNHSGGRCEGNWAYGSRH